MVGVRPRAASSAADKWPSATSTTPPPVRSLCVVSPPTSRRRGARVYETDEYNRTEPKRARARRGQSTRGCLYGSLSGGTCYLPDGGVRAVHWLRSPRRHGAGEPGDRAAVRGHRAGVVAALYVWTMKTVSDISPAPRPARRPCDVRSANTTFADSRSLRGPECGYRFSWRSCATIPRRFHPWLFEHHPEANAWSFLQTLVGGVPTKSFSVDAVPDAADAAVAAAADRGVLGPVADLPLVVAAARRHGRRCRGSRPVQSAMAQPWVVRIITDDDVERGGVVITSLALLLWPWLTLPYHCWCCKPRSDAGEYAMDARCASCTLAT